MSEVETRTDVWFETPVVTIQQRTNRVEVSIQESGQGITELKVYAETLQEILDSFEDRFEGNTRVAVNFNAGQASAWLHTEHADQIQNDIRNAVDLGIRQVIQMADAK